MGDKQLNLSHKKKLLEDLKDEGYRRGFVEGHATDTIAFQLRMLRKARNWEQRDVAEHLGGRNLQPMVSRYENPDYGRYSIETLLKLAAAFDVALIARFAPFSELVEWDFAGNPAQLVPCSFKDDKHLNDLLIAENRLPQGVVNVANNNIPRSIGGFINVVEPSAGFDTQIGTGPGLPPIGLTGGGYAEEAIKATG